MVPVKPPNHPSRWVIGLVLFVFLQTQIWAGAMQDVKAAIVQRDYQAALQLLTELAEQGDVDAQFQLASMYRAGQGVAVDDAIALKWFSSAAERGHTKSQYNLAVLYEEGWGTIKSIPTAIRWYQMASDSGHNLAKRRLDAISAETDQINAAGSGLDQEAIDRFFTYVLQNEVYKVDKILKNDTNNELVKLLDEYGQTALAKAIEGEQLEMVSLLLKHGASMGSTGESVDGVPLLQALKTKNREIIRFLIESNAPLDLVDARGNTALHYTVLDNNKNILELLLQSGANPDIVDARDRTALDHALLNDRHLLAKVLKKHGAKPGKSADSNRDRAALLIAEVEVNQNSIDSNPFKGWPALNIAAWKGDRELVKGLLGKDLDINSLDPSGMTPLMRAVNRGHRKMARQLVAAGAQTTILLPDGRSAFSMAMASQLDDLAELLVEKGLPIAIDGVEPFLITATRKGLQKTIMALLRSGADVNVTFRKRTALHWLAQSGLTILAEQLIDAGVGIDKRDSAGQSALHVAALYGHDKFVNLLLNYGVDYKLTDNVGNTALAQAAARGELSALKVLLAAGATANNRNSIGDSPLMLASQQGHSPSVLELIRYDAIVAERNDLSSTALMMAAEFGHIEVVRILIDAGASPQRRNKDGANSIEIAEAEGYTDIAVQLRAKDGAFGLFN